MVRVFVSHPLSGNFEGNRARVNRICKRIAESGRLPISPLHLFSFYDSEDDELREAIMQVCFRLIDICDEVWVYGIVMVAGARRLMRGALVSVRYCPQSTRAVKAIKRRRSQKGYFKFKLQCPSAIAWSKDTCTAMSTLASISAIAERFFRRWFIGIMSG